MDRSDKNILWFNELSIGDVPLVGGKNASLGEMYRELRGVSVPNGFAVTASAYRYFISFNKLDGQIKRCLYGLNVKNVRMLAERGALIRRLIQQAVFPEDLRKEIVSAYVKLSHSYRQIDTDVAVRSSATAEDLPDASFAGQQETYLNIKGEHALLDACRDCFASLFTNRAIAYRVEKKFDHFKVALSIGVQKMVRSDSGSAGVIFTLDTETGFPNAVLVTGSYGLGENVVQGAVNPDEWYVFKPTLKLGKKPLIQKSLGEKATKIIYSEDSTHPIKKIDTPLVDRENFCLSDDEVLKLAKWACIIEDHYTKKRGVWTPMDIEWAKDGRTGDLFIVQARPETVQSQKNRNIYEEYSLLQKGKVLTVGKSVGSKISQGSAQVIKSVKQISDFREGDVLVTEMTDPDWVPVMRIAKAIVTNRGGRTCHAAIVSRELGIPCVVGTGNATEVIKSGRKVTVSCAEGEEGKIYDGFLKFKVEKTDLRNIPDTKTKVLLNIGNPESAFEQSFLPVDGVGLAREEFIINEYIKVHPMALIHYDKLDSDSKKQVDVVTKGYKNRKDFFVEKLAQGVGMIAAAFWPKPVIVRMSDFKTNEYANLIGGKFFEPVESNPMIGWRGASRYYKEGYREGFALECLALKKAIEEYGLSNIKTMIPMVRTPDEGRKVRAEMKKQGLTAEVYVMCEIPVNVILADEYAKIFDGFSIGTNDLTQFTLAVDRDSELVSDIYDERNLAVKSLVKHAIERAKVNHRKIGICGDAPSTYPEFARFLVDCGIDSVSLSPDAVVKTKLLVAEHEKKRKR